MKLFPVIFIPVSRRYFPDLSANEETESQNSYDACTAIEDLSPGLCDSEATLKPYTWLHSTKVCLLPHGPIHSADTYVSILWEMFTCCTDLSDGSLETQHGRASSLGIGTVVS